MLVVAAAREELGDLPGAVVGVGPVVAAAEAGKLLAEQRPDSVVLIGTAGAYPGGPKIGAVIASGTLGLSWGIAALGQGYVPRPPEPIMGDPRLLSRSGLPRQRVLTTGAITTDAALARQLGEAWSVEHLEAFSVAWACQAAGVPFLAILGVANEVGPDAHAQWLTHRNAAQDAARACAAQLLHGDSS